MTGQGPGSDRTGLADHPRTTLSPREAARLAQVGRSSIMRAIARGDLSACRDNRNQWRIELEVLERWLAGRPDHDRIITEDHDRSRDRAAPDHLLVVAQELAEARAQVAEMQVRAEQLEGRLDERAALVRMAEDRALASDTARAAAEARAQGAEALAAKLTDILATRPVSAPEPSSPRRRWWPWGRG